jgi:hypothetical protein
MDSPREAKVESLPGSPPPVDQDSRVRYVPNNTPGEQPTYRYADANNPNLTQWAKDQLKKDNELQDKGFHMFSRAGALLARSAAAFRFSPGTPTYFIQTPKQVLMIYDRRSASAARLYGMSRISRDPKPSWYGESLGTLR